MRGSATTRSRLDLSGSHEPKDVPLHGARDGARPELDPMPGEELGDGFAGSVTEQLERPGLRGHELERDLHARVGEVNGRQQCELVERQRPGDAGRHRERQPLHASFPRVAQDLAEGRFVARATERDRAGNGRHRPSAEREQEQVVRELFSRCGLDGLLGGMHRPNGSLLQLGAGLVDQAAEREAPSFSEAERRGHGEGAVHELRVRRDDLDRDPILGHRSESERCFEPRNSGSGYEDVGRRHVDLSGSLRIASGREIRTGPERGCGIPALPIGRSPDAGRRFPPRCFDH